MSHEVFSHLAGLLAGTVIGAVLSLSLGFLARRQTVKGSTKKYSGPELRIASLLLALIAVQVVCPVLLNDGTEWWVSGAVVAGYGGMQFRERLKAKKASRT